MLIGLATCDNSLYRADLEKHGFKIKEYDINNSPESLNHRVLADAPDWLITGSDHRIISSLHELTSGPSFKSNILVHCDQVDDNLKNMLLAAGICNLLQKTEPGFIRTYISTLDEINISKHPGLVLLDDNPHSTYILRSIVQRYGENLIIVPRLDEMVKEALTRQAQFVIVNIATQGLDLNALFRTYIANSDLKKIPFLAFRDMSGGISVQDITCGLNRITRYIFTPAEIYACLTDLLFRRELATQVIRLKHDSSLDQIAPLAKDSLRQAFRMCENSLSHLSGLIEEPVQKRLFTASDRIRNLIIRTQGLRWLCRSMSVETISTFESDG